MERAQSSHESNALGVTSASPRSYEASSHILSSPRLPSTYTSPRIPTRKTQKNFPLYKGPLGLPRSYQLFSALNARSVIRLLSQLHCSDRSISSPPAHPPVSKLRKRAPAKARRLKLTPPVHVTKQPQTSQRRKPSFVTVFTPKPSYTICWKNR